MRSRRLVRRIAAELLAATVPIKKTVIEQLSPRTLTRFKERFELEKARMLEDKLYREYKREMHYY